jgi:hypothetical protein
MSRSYSIGLGPGLVHRSRTSAPGFSRSAPGSRRHAADTTHYLAGISRRVAWNADWGGTCEEHTGSPERRTHWQVRFPTISLPLWTSGPPQCGWPSRKERLGTGSGYFGGRTRAGADPASGAILFEAPVR